MKQSQNLGLNGSFATFHLSQKISSITSSKQDFDITGQEYSISFNGKFSTLDLTNETQEIHQHYRFSQSFLIPLISNISTLEINNNHE
ncbi:MAG: hypothetical protein KI793_08335 [Rivularia sp. (in: Bacteria)]|nr:hypothetical protein [Rivularia sp. MS3]